MPSSNRDFENLRLFEHPLIQEKLTRARDRRTSTREFRRLLNEIAGLMTFEVSRNFPTRRIDIETPLEKTTGIIISNPITLVPILRAGVGMTDGILALVPEARVGHLGIYRDEQTLQPISYYAKLPPDVAQGPVLLIDPMLATGGSALASLDLLTAAGARQLRVACIVAAPEGIAAIEARHPGVHIYTPAVDRALNARKFILPGLGDFGDRLYGTV